PRARAAPPARGIPDRPLARRSRGHAARGSRARDGVSRRHRQVEDLQGEGAVARVAARLQAVMNERFSDASDEELGRRLRAERPMRSVVAEHERALMWGARRPEAIPTALPWLTQESGIGLTRVFGGDDRLAFRGAEPVYLEGRRGIALHYRDADGHLVTYMVLPAPALPLPDRQ